MDAESLQQPTKISKTMIEPPTDFSGWLTAEDLLSSVEMSELLGLLDIDSHDTKPSHVFNRVTKSNLVNKHLRSSCKIEYRDDQVFEWIDSHVVKPLNEKMDQFKFYLVRNDVEVVKYSEGDFFKKHQDYINFDSNEFRNYTFLLCLQGCDEGGETIVYENVKGEEQQYVVECTARRPGSILVFQKTLIHEGRLVEKGQKILLKGNLLAFKQADVKDYVIVELEQANDEPWVISVELMKLYQPNCTYLSFYHFEKQKYPEKCTFVYKESLLTPLQFSVVYREIMDKRELEANMKALNYAGLTRDTKMIYKFREWMCDKESTLLVCGIRDYYEMLGLGLESENVIPYQMVTIESAETEILAWLGVGTNQFVTCDYYINDDDMEEYGNDFTKAFKAMESFEFNAHRVMPDRKWKYLIKGWEKPNQQIREYLWKQYGLQPLSTFMIHSGVAISEQIHKFIYELISKLSFDKHEDGADGTYFISNKHNYSLIADKFIKHMVSNETLSQQQEKFNTSLKSLVDKVGVTQLVQQILSNNSVSNLAQSQLSEFYCNETYYLTYNVVCRTGFYKV